MKNVRLKASVLCIVFTLCVLLIPSINTRADSYPSEFYVNSGVYYSPEQLFVAFVDLNDDQEQIACYLLGMYNLFYLGARGFQFNAGAYTSESSFIAKVKSFGYRLFQGAAEVTLKSRMDPDFCKYASAVILYASQCNIDFNTWFGDIDDTFVLPVDQGIINSFTLLYNDNDNDSISGYGDSISPWGSGLLYSYAFGDYPFSSNSSQNNYISFLSDYSPVLYSKVYVGSGPIPEYQLLISLKDKVYPNTIYILRSQNTYKYYTYGFTELVDGQVVFSKNFDTDYKYCVCTYGSNYTPPSVLVQISNSYQSLISKSTLESNPVSDLSDFIDSIIKLSPFKFGSIDYRNSAFDGAYPYIYHVVLVDDLNTLANPQEVFNTDTWDIIGLNPNMIQPIDTVEFQPKVITTINLPDNTSSPVEISDIIGIDDTEWIPTVVQPNDTNPDSVDVNLFSQATVYLDYLWNSTKKLVSYCSDLLDCFAYTDENGSLYGPKMAIYGVITLGLAGGMVAKFLL